MAAKQLSDGKGNFLPSFHLPLSSSNVEPTSDNSPSERSYDVTACHRRHSETLTRAQDAGRVGRAPPDSVLPRAHSGDKRRHITEGEEGETLRDACAL